MKLIYEGKTKNVFQLEDGNYLLKLKDDATGKDGVFDPGENSVGLTILGLGRESLKMSEYYFDKLKKSGVKTHFVASDIENVTMTVKPAKIFGKGIEVVCRLRATGSFMKRYGDYINEGDELDYLVEFTLKDEHRADPPLAEDTLIMLNIMTEEQIAEIKPLVKQAARIIKVDMEEKGLALYDIKFEFGLIDGKVAMIDEISGGNMRVYKGDKWMQPMELKEYFNQ